MSVNLRPAGRQGVLELFCSGNPPTLEIVSRTPHKKQAKGRSCLPPIPQAPETLPWGSEDPAGDLLLLQGTRPEARHSLTWVKFPLADSVTLINPFTFLGFLERLLRGLHELIPWCTRSAVDLRPRQSSIMGILAPCGWSEWRLLSIKYTPDSKDLENRM